MRNIMFLFLLLAGCTCCFEEVVFAPFRNKSVFQVYFLFMMKRNLDINKEICHEVLISIVGFLGNLGSVFWFCREIRMMRDLQFSRSSRWAWKFSFRIDFLEEPSNDFKDIKHRPPMNKTKQLVNNLNRKIEKFLKKTSVN